MPASFTFLRPELARSYCDSLEGTGIIDSRSGLFFSAPRRTGKSTFIRNDLLPAMEMRGWTVVYVDLWLDKGRDPGILIAGAIKAKLAQFEGVIKKLAKRSGLEKVNLFGALSLNLNTMDLPVDITLADALEALVVAGEAPVALVIDEAQHALSTKGGTDAMFALKAARDRLNLGSGEQKLHLVFTGSSRDKLAQLTLKRNQPFFGARVDRFPLLDKRFTDAYTDYLNARLAADNQFGKDAMFEAFKLVGHRPELLRNIISDVALEGGADGFSERLKDNAKQLRALAQGEVESELASLTPLQKAVLTVLVRDGENFVPFSAASVKAYADLLGQQDVSTASVQGALDALREKNLIWRASHGSYALEDESLALWFGRSEQP